VSLVIDRVTASRLGIAPTTIDNTLYDAFGQRQINTMYTQLNQYHVILESAAAVPARSQQAEHLHPGERASGAAAPARVLVRVLGSSSAGSNALTGDHRRSTRRLRRIRLRARQCAHAEHSGQPARARPRGPPASPFMSNAVPLSAFSHFENDDRAALDQSPGTVSGDHGLVQSGAERRAGRAITAITKVQKDMHMPPACRPISGHRGIVPNSLSNEPLLILAALVTVYIVLGVCTRASFIRSRFFPRCLRRASARFLALMLFHQDLSVVAIIGIVLLIGIVKKNGIMMVDFALEASASTARIRPTRSTRPACCASVPS
jgi:multidrug efflux pump